MPKKKGGKVQGRAKQKVKAQNAHSGGKAPWMKKFARSFDDDDDNDNPMFRGFAQRSGESTPRESGLKLRHQSIAFVSAGTNTPVEKEDKSIQEEEITVALDEEDDDDDDDDDEVEDEAMQATMDDDVDDSTMENTMVTDTDVDIAQGTKAMHIHEHVEAPIPALDGTVDSRPDAAPATLSKPPTPPQEETLSFVIDTEGDPSLSRPSKSQANVPTRPASPTPSDSSEEVILFHGRNNPKVVDDPIVSSRDSSKRRQAPEASQKVPSQKAAAKSRTPQPPAGEAHVTDELLAALLGESNGQVASDARGWAAKAPKWDQQLQSASEEFTPAPAGSWWRKGAPRPDLDPSPAEKEALETVPRGPTKVAFAEPEEDKGAEETIASLQAEWDQTRRDKKKAKQAQKQADDEFEDIEESDVGLSKPANELSVRDLVGKTSRRGKRGRKRSNKLLRDLQSDQTDDEEAAYNDYMENLRAQIEAGEEVDITGIRSAEGGPSLVVDGRAVDESEVLDGSTRQANFDELRMMDTDSDSEDEELGMDMDDLEDEDDEDASEFDSSDLEEELLYNEQEQWEDEDDLRQRRIDAMDDETLARLWAKQAELGISDDDLVIDDGAFMEVDDLDGFGDLDQAKAGLADLANSSFAQSTSKRGSSKKKNGGFSFPNASALADSVDQYGDIGFDIMDFERPSLKPKRGRKGKLPPELDALSDDDLKDEMLGHWSNDREKKRLKKAEREELRMQGLLGAAGKKGKADLGQKYQQGMTMPQIHEELRAFLQDAGKTTRAFPPMDKHDRKALHELANALNLKSKSVGAGKNRAPVLYKTARSADVSDAMFRRVAAASNRGFLKNSAFKGKKPKGGALPKAQRGGKGRGADTGSTGLRHGDVVGGGAKEIGRENFGHRLMEKMGWQKGTALGKEGSGLLTPVEQIMRTGRSGLG